MVAVRFAPSGLSGEVAAGTTVLDAARDLGVDLDSVCGGRGLCGRCQITPLPADAVSPWTSVETNYRGRRPIADGDRLGCAALIVADVAVDVPVASQINAPIVAKAVDVGEIRLDPLITLHYLDLGSHTDDNDDGSAVATRLAAALAEQWALDAVTVEPRLLASLHAAMAIGRATVAVRDSRVVVGIWPGLVDRIVGLAVDVGSTTIAGHLCELTTGDVLATAGRMNPQIRFGEDLMSRVSYAMMNPGGAEAMTAAVRDALDELIGELVAATDDPALDRSHLLDIVVVANPIMHHLVLGIDPTPLGQAPFPLATAEPVETSAPALGLDAPNAAVFVGPCIAGHVGADTTAAMLAEGPHRSDRIQLLVDVGTNAEIVIGNRDRLYAASSPTGPAFEGAQISSGQRAAPGAIERVRVVGETLEPRFKVIGTDAWSDEPGFDPATSVTGICGSGIIEAIAELFTAGVIDAQGVIVGAAVERTDRVVADGRTFAYRLTDSIRITQADVRAIQLAKAALRAGIELVRERAGIDTIDEVRLAGAFGSHISPAHALTLGLVPVVPLDAIRSVGNAAGAGAVRALLSAEQRTELAAVARSVTKIETAVEARFQDHFVAALGLPHGATDDTPKRRRRRRRTTQEQP